ncbi:MAG: hypothetical protein ACLQVX_19090 [Limisphaerales bacterium]
MNAVNSLLCCLAFAACARLSAQEATPAPGGPEAAHTVYLEYQEADRGLVSWVFLVPLQDAPFSKEPDFGRRRVWRGSLRLGSKPEDAVPFAWDPRQSKLYLDLNRNGDLTDDPNGVFFARSRSDQTFTNLHIEFKTAMGVRRLLADMSLYQPAFQRGNRLMAALACHSFWAAKVLLQGREWQVGLVENLAGQTQRRNGTIEVGVGRLGSAEDGYLLLRPWESRNQPFNLQDGSLDGFNFRRDLFIGHQAYQVDWAYAQHDGAPGFKLELKECFPALGELRLTGKFIQRLVLTGTPDPPAAGPITVVLDRPEPTVKIPVGNYSQCRIQLEAGGTQACRLAQPAPALFVGSGNAAVLTAGGPLTNTVLIVPEEGSLSLNYQLVGAEGGLYQLLHQDRRHPPGWGVYRQGEAIDTGRFQFG